MACDDSHLVEMKKHQRERKKASGEMRTYIQRRGSFGSDSSLSSSDIEDLDERARLQELSDEQEGQDEKETMREKGLRLVAEPKQIVGRLVGGKKRADNDTLGGSNLWDSAGGGGGGGYDGGHHGGGHHGGYDGGHHAGGDGGGGGDAGGGC